MSVGYLDLFCWTHEQIELTIMLLEQDLFVYRGLTVIGKTVKSHHKRIMALMEKHRGWHAGQPRGSRKEIR